MRKNTLLLFVLLSTVTTISAQVRFGVKGGLNFSREKYANTTEYSTNSHTFYAAGFLARLPIDKRLLLESGLYYSAEGTGEIIKSNSNPVTGVVRINRVNLPVLMQYRLPAGLFFQTGPQIGFLLKASGKYTTGDFEFTKSTNKLLFSWVGGAGFDLGKWLKGFEAEATYAPGLGKINKGTVNGGKLTGSTLSVKLVYLFVAKAAKRTGDQ
jgi:hypothetical protein